MYWSDSQFIFNYHKIMFGKFLFSLQKKKKFINTFRMDFLEFPSTFLRFCYLSKIKHELHKCFFFSIRSHLDALQLEWDIGVVADEREGY